MRYLKELRQNRGLSQQNVADYLEITRQAYSNYENGHRAPDNETLLKLGEFFDVSVDTLLRGSSFRSSQSSQLTTQDVKRFLFGDDADITDEMLEEVRSFASFIKLREAKKRHIL